VTNTFGISGVETHCHLLDTVEDPERIRARIVRACMQANYRTAPEQLRQGSLISIGSEGGIGTVMGFIRGAGFEIEGVVASLLYRLLYNRHLAGLFGWWSVIRDSLGRWIGSRPRQKVKLH